MRDKVKKIIAGDQLAGARLIRLLEEGDPEGREVLKLLYPHTGKAFVVGITGPAGSGKSTLVNCIVTEFRRRNLKVAVMAIDPSSSISGGALLGDRIRMRAHAEDKGVFIRSMATRGHLGGLNKTAREAVLVFDAMGFDIIVIETVGVGQDEVEIAQLAHTTAVVSLPATGDGIQAMKAGLLEIGDVFIVNKADFPGADDVVWQLKNMLEITGDSGSNWHPPILKTVAVKSEGMTDLADALLSHRQFLLESGKFSEHNYKHDIQFFRQIVMEMAADRIFNRVKDQPAFLDLLENLKKRNIDPFSAAEHVIEDMQ